VELQVNAPPDFRPPESAPPVAPDATAAPEAEADPWAKWWTNENGGRVIMWARHTAATTLRDPSLEPDKLTLELGGPALAACARAVPMGGIGGKLGELTGGRMAVVGLILILALAVGIPIMLAIKRREDRKRATANRDEVVGAPTAPEEGPDPGTWRARPRVVGDGLVGVNG